MHTHIHAHRQIDAHTHTHAHAHTHARRHTCRKEEGNTFSKINISILIKVLCGEFTGGSHG